LKRQKAEDDLQAAMQEVQRLKDHLYRENLALRDEVDRGLNVRGNCRRLEAAEGRCFSDCPKWLRPIPQSLSLERLARERNAQQRLGRFELADGGTIFLDEVWANSRRTRKSRS
jgi:hypothetical protein